MSELRFAITQQQNSFLDIINTYTGCIGRRITEPRIRSNTGSTLLRMDDKASSPCLKIGGTHRSRHSKSKDSSSLTHSFIQSVRYMIGTYFSLFKCLVQFIYFNLFFCCFFVCFFVVFSVLFSFTQ